MDSIPTASVTGQQDWEWNRMQDDRRAGAQSQGTQSTDPHHAASTHRPRGATAPDVAGTDRRALVAALDRKDRRLQAVITRYERLLEERERELAEANADETRPSRTTNLVQAVRRLVARW